MYLTDKQVAARYSVVRECPWKWAREGSFPKPIRLSHGCTRWKISDLEEWERQRALASVNETRVPLPTAVADEVA